MGTFSSLPLLILLLAPAQSRPTISSSASDAWTRVTHLSRRDHVVVTLNDGRMVKGDFDHADETSIRVGGRNELIDRAQVRHVAVVTDMRKRNRVIGFLVGAVIGTVASELHCGSGPSCREGAALYFWPGAGIGLLVGAAIPGKVTFVEIYPGP